ncbi:MAG: DUF6702 family protein [Planctomycetota bacterium]
MIIAACCVLTGVVAAHPGHVSFAEIERDAETGRLEVAMRVLPEDAERVLEQRAGGPVDLASPEAEPLMIAWLDEMFVVAPGGDEPPPEDYRPPAVPDRDGDGEPDARILWVGVAERGRDMWLLFEVEPPEDLGSLHEAWFMNRICFDIEPEQENILRVRQGDRRVTIRSDMKNPWVSAAHPILPSSPPNPPAGP